MPELRSNRNLFLVARALTTRQACGYPGKNVLFLQWDLDFFIKKQLGANRSSEREILYLKTSFSTGGAILTNIKIHLILNVNCFKTLF